MAAEGGIVGTVGAAIGARAGEGGTPGVAVATAISTRVAVVGYDLATRIATFATAEGKTLGRMVAPEMRKRAAARSRSDRVFVEVLEIVALGVEETEE